MQKMAFFHSYFPSHLTSSIYLNGTTLWLSRHEVRADFLLHIMKLWCSLFSVLHAACIYSLNYNSVVEMNDLETQNKIQCQSDGFVDLINDSGL